ncbi:MAG: Holliday junction branch migration protein RuvA [Clostridiales bacterium]|nr:Holliday junction branch migration protein RuvA [Clostridiales bacterium]
MIGYLKGKVINIGVDSAIIVVSGVGYEVYCSGSAFSKMTEGGECEVYTYLQVSEANGVQLYGFSSLQEKAMFLKLISVSGVGPKVGIAILSQMSVNDVAVAVATNDIKALSRVKGMGKKTAEKIIVELRDRVAAPIGGGGGADASPVVNVTSGDEDAVVALISLGFTRAESERAVAKAKAGGAKSVEDIIMVALKGM